MSITDQICTYLSPYVLEMMVENEWDSLAEFDRYCGAKLTKLTIKEFIHDKDFIDLFLIDDVLCALYDNPTSEDAFNMLSETVNDLLWDKLEMVIKGHLTRIDLWRDQFDKTQGQEDAENRAEFDRTEAKSINNEQSPYCL